LKQTGALSRQPRGSAPSRLIHQHKEKLSRKATWHITLAGQVNGRALPGKPGCSLSFLCSLLKGVEPPMWGDFSIREKILLALLVLLLLGGVLWKAAPAVVSTINPGRQAEQIGLLPQEPAPAPEPDPEMITVHLVGAVKKPGIYHLPAGSRVYELIEAAGGALEDADTDSINLARPLYDGEQVNVYHEGEAATDPAPAGQKVNINKASAGELMTLPQIGEGRAQKIIEHREKYGPFTDIKEIMDVSGIGQGIFNQIKDLITVY
jgi:competence protein ComEA